MASDAEKMKASIFLDGFEGMKMVRDAAAAHIAKLVDGLARVTAERDSQRAASDGLHDAVDVLRADLARVTEEKIEAFKVIEALGKMAGTFREDALLLDRLRWAVMHGEQDRELNDIDHARWQAIFESLKKEKTDDT